MEMSPEMEREIRLARNDDVMDEAYLNGLIEGGMELEMGRAMDTDVVLGLGMEMEGLNVRRGEALGWDEMEGVDGLVFECGMCRMRSLGDRCWVTGCGLYGVPGEEVVYGY